MTGVQTCALPISNRRRIVASSNSTRGKTPIRRDLEGDVVRWQRPTHTPLRLKKWIARATCTPLPRLPSMPRGCRSSWSLAPEFTFATTRRSEERRVGKSVDLGGRRIIKKKIGDERGRAGAFRTTNSTLQSMTTSRADTSGTRRYPRTGSATTNAC